MAIFTILPKAPNPVLDAKIKDSFSPENVFQLNNCQWLVSADMTTKQVTERLGIPSDPELHSIAVFSINNYFGRYSPDLWEWLKVEMEKSS